MGRISNLLIQVVILFIYFPWTPASLHIQNDTTIPLFSNFSSLPFSKPFDVNIKLKTAWPHVSILQEAIEFISEIDPNDVLSSLNVIATTPFSKSGNNYHAMANVLKAFNATLYASPFTGPLLDFVTSNKFYSGRVEFLRGLQRRIMSNKGYNKSLDTSCSDSDTWAVFCTPVQVSHKKTSFSMQVFCDKQGFQTLYDTLNNVLKRDGYQYIEGELLEDYHPCRLLTFDHFLYASESLQFDTIQSPNVLYEPKNKAWGPSLIIYSSLNILDNNSHHNFQLLMEYLNTLMNSIEKNETQRNKISIVFRHGDSSQCRPTSYNTSLTGTQDFCMHSSECCKDYLGMYSAELAVKNPEYKTLDEDADGASEANAKNRFMPSSTTAQKNNIISEEEDDREERGYANHENGQSKETTKETIDNYDSPDRILSSRELSTLGFKAIIEIQKGSSSVFSSQFNSCVDNFNCSYSTLDTWQYLSSNFPSVAVALSTANSSYRSLSMESIIAAVKRLRRRIPARAQAVTINQGYVEGSSPIFSHAFLEAAHYALAVEYMMRAGMDLKSSTDLLKYHYEPSQQPSVSKTKMLEKKEQRFYYTFGALPTRLDWRLPKNWNEDKQTKSRHSLWEDIPLVPVWDVKTNPATITWSDEPHPFLFMMDSAAGASKIRQRYSHILIVFNPLDYKQLANALDLLTLESSSVIYFIPYIDSRCTERILTGGIAMKDDATDNDYGRDVCRKQWIVTEMFYRRLIPSEAFEDDDNIDEELQLAAANRAVGFLKQLLQRLKETTDLPSEAELIDIYNLQRASYKKSDLKHRWNHKTNLAAKSVEYCQRKGIIANTVIINGRFLPLKSLSETVAVPGAKTLVAYGQIISILIYREQQMIIQTHTFSGHTLETLDVDEIVFSEHGAAPSCLFPEYFFEKLSTQEDLQEPGLCEYMMLTEISEHISNPKSIFSRFLQQGSSFENGYKHRHVSILPLYNEIKGKIIHPKSIKGIPEFFTTTTEKKKTKWSNNDAPSSQNVFEAFSVDDLLIIDFNFNGLKILQKFLTHVHLSLLQKSLFIESFSNIPLEFTWRVFIRSDDDSHIGISEGAKYLSTLLRYLMFNNKTPILETFFEQNSQQQQHEHSHELCKLKFVQQLLNMIINEMKSKLLSIKVLQNIFEQFLVTQGIAFSKVESMEFHKNIAELMAQPKYDPELEGLWISLQRESGLLNDTTSQLSGMFILNSMIHPIYSDIINILENDYIFSVLEIMALGNILKSTGLTSFNNERSVNKKKTVIDHILTDGNNLSSSVLSYALALKQRINILVDRWPFLSELHEDVKPILRSYISKRHKNLPSLLNINAVLDPLSTYTQEWIPLLNLFSKLFNAEVRIIFNPTERLKEYPLNRWYRQVMKEPTILKLTESRELSSTQEKNDEEKEQEPLMAYFKNLETSHTLTVALHVPDHWLVRAFQSDYDLDNLRPIVALNDAPESHQVLSAEYILSDLFVTGQALPAQVVSSSFDKIIGVSSKELAGLQLSLHSSTDSILAKQKQHSYRHFPFYLNESDDKFKNETLLLKTRDTLVMGLLGYFQLRASPGLFWLSIDHHTQQSSLIKDQYSIYMRTPSPIDEFRTIDVLPKKYVPVVVNNLLGKPHKIYLVRTLHNQSTSISLLKLEAQRFLTYPFIQTYKYFKDHVLQVAHNTTPCHEVIHIFTLASGHMYERLLRIMILSLRRHTACPLMFWFVDNFLSPKFKMIMPEMGKRYNVSYQYVTYKWPAWLRKQTEKQRQIWAYKVLFLDVLFPKDVPRIIYVDADQIIRADIKELWDMNLEGKAYGFTPFCHTNPTTKDYRFWETGYWREHLQGKPYHISALFVVDLNKFRELGAGDMLRFVYNQLSRDKNSLANLDQDLPNFAQHELPIFSLPQEWLWCETWCGNKTLPLAKTIDLCNNPLTKEPKLSQARRIAPEWEIYDQEIRQLEAEVLTGNTFQTSSEPVITTSLKPPSSSPSRGPIDEL